MLWWGTLGVTGLIVLTSGCDQRMADVEGTVTQGGQPLADVEVLFLPDPREGTQGPTSRGITDAAGRYRLLTNRGEVGCVAGSHRVCMRDIRAIEHPERSRIPPVYNDVAATPLQREVKPGKQTLNFDLQ